MDEFLIRALIGGGFIALLSGPFGCFLLWRRMAFFGDTLAHAALLGVAMGLLLSVDIRIGMIGICGAIALLLAKGRRLHWLTSDTLLGICAHAALAAGMVALAFVDGVAVDLMAYLFGDVLAISWTDIVWIGGVGSLCLFAMLYLWPRLLAATVSEEIAFVEGVRVDLVRTGLMVLTAVIVGLAIKVVGVLLITALLIIPAAAARPFVRTPEMMAVMAGLTGLLSVCGGLAASYHWDLPAGPAIVLAAAVLMVLTNLGRGMIRA